MHVVQTEMVGPVRFRMMQKGADVARFYVIADHDGDDVVVPIGFLGHDLGQAERRFDNSLNKARVELAIEQDSGT